MERFKRAEYPKEHHRTLRESIVDFLKEAIIKGHLRPGERIPEPELAERFGVSRTPIREAFRQLESDGFLTVIPRKGAVVSPITDKDVREFYAIKSLLEGFAARSACADNNFSNSEIKKMEGLNMQMSRLAEKGDYKGFFKLDNQFHDIFWKACGNDKLYSLFNNLVQQFERFRITSLSRQGRMKNSVKQHDDIIGAFKKRDAALVDELVRANAEQGGEALVQKILEEQVQ